MHAAGGLMILSFLQLQKVDGFTVSSTPEEGQDEQDVETGIGFFLLRNRALDSCLDVPWDDFERALDEFTPVGTHRKCHGGGNQLLQLRDGRLVSYQVPCLCLGARQLRDGEAIGLVPVGDEGELKWTLDGDGGLHVSNTTLRIGSTALNRLDQWMNGGKMILRQATHEDSTWRLEELRVPLPGQRLPANESQVGKALFLTPFIERGRLEAARHRAKVTGPLDGIGALPFDSYSGFITTNKTTNSNIFFWFFPATEVAATEAPVVIWLQGGPGSSSLFGLFEIHGPIGAVFENGTQNGRTVGRLNPHSWSRRANMIYVDNPVGAGYSFAQPEGLPRTQSDVADDLYAFLDQFFALFPEYRLNAFYAFGESYAGKWVPTICKRIHDMNQVSDLKINLVGFGIGNGWIAPEHQSVYANFLYQSGVIDGAVRDELLVNEGLIRDHLQNGDYCKAYLVDIKMRRKYLSVMSCSYPYDVTQCHEEPEEDNYEDYASNDATRFAIHAGKRPFLPQGEALYRSMAADIFQCQKPELEFLLNNYWGLLYEGNNDIIVNHGGVVALLENMSVWEGKDEYYGAKNEPLMTDGKLAGYMKSVKKLRHVTLRGAGHVAPRSQPEAAFDMFKNFLDESVHQIP